MPFTKKTLDDVETSDSYEKNITFQDSIPHRPLLPFGVKRGIPQTEKSKIKTALKSYESTNGFIEKIVEEDNKLNKTTVVLGVFIIATVMFLLFTE